MGSVKSEFIVLSTELEGRELKRWWSKGIETG